MADKSRFGRRHVFRVGPRPAPRCPIIRFGEHAGRAVRDLSDAELQHFLKRDARGQTRSVVFLLSVNPVEAPDLSHYWYGKYEMERRRHVAQSRARILLGVEPHDSLERIVRKLFQYGFHTASQVYRADRGSTAIMQRLKGAKELFLSAFQSKPERESLL